MATATATPTTSDLYLLCEIARAARAGAPASRITGMVGEAAERKLGETQPDALAHAVQGDEPRTVSSYRPTTPAGKIQQRQLQLQAQLRRERRRGDQVAADLTQGELYGLRFALEALGA